MSVLTAPPQISQKLWNDFMLTLDRQESLMLKVVLVQHTWTRTTVT